MDPASGRSSRFVGGNHHKTPWQRFYLSSLSIPPSTRVQALSHPTVKCQSKFSWGRTLPCSLSRPISSSLRLIFLPSWHRSPIFQSSMAFPVSYAIIIIIIIIADLKWILVRVAFRGVRLVVLLSYSPSLFRWIATPLFGSLFRFSRPFTPNAEHWIVAFGRTNARSPKDSPTLPRLLPPTLSGSLSRWLLLQLLLLMVAVLV